MNRITVNILMQVVEKMRRDLLLVTVFLILKLRCSQSRCEEPESRKSISDVPVGFGGFWCVITKLIVSPSID